MKVLQLCNKVPFPERDGGSLGASVFTKALLEAGHEVKMLAMNTSRHHTDISSIPQKLKDSIALETVNVNTSINPISAAFALIIGKSYHVSRFVSRGFNKKLRDILQKESFDIIQLEGLYLTPYIKTIRANSKARIILRENNIEWIIWDRLARAETRKLKRTYLNILIKQLKEYEQSVINLCDGIITFTKNDMHKLKEMGCRIPMAHIPFGIHPNNVQPTVPSDENTLFYIGALDWQPNIQGLDWFLQHVWTKVNEAYPNLKFHVAGRNMPDTYKLAQYPNVVFHGEVEDARKFMETYNIMLVPLLAGSGIRVKIIEGMEMQRPVITTTVGLEGIDCIKGTDTLVADTPEGFYNAIKKCMDNPLFTAALAANGRIYCLMHHNITRIVENLAAFYKALI